MNLYTCALCMKDFEGARSDEEAMAEKAALWGDIPVEECEVVCEDCFNLIMPTNVTLSV